MKNFLSKRVSWGMDSYYNIELKEDKFSNKEISF